MFKLVGMEHFWNLICCFLVGIVVFFKEGNEDEEEIGYKISNSLCCNVFVIFQRW